MTLSVDMTSNSLIVGAPDYLYEDVKAFVAALDVAAVPANETIRVVNLKRADSDFVHRELLATIPTATITRSYPQLLNPTAPGAQLANNRTGQAVHGRVHLPRRRIVRHAILLVAEFPEMLLKRKLPGL